MSYQKLTNRLNKLITIAASITDIREVFYGEDLLKFQLAAKAHVEWESLERWNFSVRGYGLIVARMSGFVIRLPRMDSVSWCRHVIAHEIGHTLFYDSSKIGSASYLWRFPLPRDIWLPKAAEEEYCDEVAYKLLEGA